MATKTSSETLVVSPVLNDGTARQPLADPGLKQGGMICGCLSSNSNLWIVTVQVKPLRRGDWLGTPMQEIVTTAARLLLSHGGPAAFHQSKMVIVSQLKRLIIKQSCSL